MYKYFILFLCFSLTSFLFSQGTNTTLLKNPALSDSLSQSVLKDSTTVANDTTAGKKSDIDDIIYASGTDSLIFNVKKKGMEIYGSGELKYKKTELKSANIYIDFNTNRIHAVGVKDTSDTSGNKFSGTPVLTESGEVYEGSAINYDFKTQQGFISLAKNEAEGTYYAGEKVKKVNNDTYFIKNGIYTTCEADPTHYHFSASEMKVIMKNQIIGKWIFLYVGGVPLPIPLPFGVFPNQKGRRSGIIAPAYGERADYGQYLSHFGYFWAINDYIDVNSLADYYFRGGYTLRSRLRYAERYALNGNFEVSFSNLHSGERSDIDYSKITEWRMSLYHNQTIDPTTRLDANLQFQSSNFNKLESTNYSDILTQNITSNANFHKIWDKSNNSLSISYTRSQNLSNGNYTENLPSLSFSMPQKYPFKRKGNSGNTADSKWYELIGYDYSGQFLNTRTKTGEIKDTAGIITKPENLNIRGGIQHNVSSSASPKVGYFNISPRINFSEKWYNKSTRKVNYIVRDWENRTNPNAQKDSVVDVDVHEFNAVHSFDVGVAASTKLYGMFNINALGVNAIRHTLTPSISYSYQPDFSDPKLGYYDSYTSYTDEEVRYDKFAKEVFGGVGQGERQSINFGLQNVFEMKTLKDATDTTSEAKKIQLLNLSASTSYNFAASRNKLSDLNLNFGTQISNLIIFNGNASYSFYELIRDNNGRNVTGEKYLIKTGQGLLRLRQFYFSINTSLSAALFNKQPEKKEKNKTSNETQRPIGLPPMNRNVNQDIYSDEPPDFSIPWDLNLNLNYSNNKESDNAKTASLRAAFNFSLTQSLKFSFEGGYDLISKQLSTPSVRIYKDLHCWEMNLTWNPIGVYRGYRFEIRVKAPQLQDLKVERARGQFSGRYF